MGSRATSPPRAVRQTGVPARFAAWSAHAYTACGAAMGLMALLAVIAHDLRAAFLWLAAQVFVDATDGVIARAARVGDVTPRVDGARLDDIIDYFTYVVVPAVMVVEAQLAPAGLAVPVAAAMLVSSAIGFSKTDAKTDDHFFSGFPSYWNIVLLYLVAFGGTAVVNAAVLLTLAVCVFMPVRFVYPTRTRILRSWTIALGALWAALMLGVIWSLDAPPPWLLGASLVFPVYYVGLSVVLEWQRSMSSSD